MCSVEIWMDQNTVHVDYDVVEEHMHTTQSFRCDSSAGRFFTELYRRKAEVGPEPPI